MAEGKSQNQEKSSTFTMDADTTQTMPSVTKLLNRKKLGIPESYKKDDPKTEALNPPPFEPKITPPESQPIPNNEVSQSEPLEISLHIEPESIAPNTVESSSAAVNSDSRPTSTRSRTRREVPTLKAWSKETLSSDPHPNSRDLLSLLDAGAHAFLLLTAHPPHPGGAHPQFQAEAAFAEASPQIQAWTGLRWKPELTPALWNAFIHRGLAEASPPGAVTEPSSDRNLIRAAFACPPEETLTLIRLGPPNACSGALILISKSSILEKGQAAIQNLTSAHLKAA